MKLVGSLDRFVVREVVAPAAMGLVIYTFMLMMRAIFDLVEQIFVRGVAVQDALLLLWTTLPHVVVLTIPMSYLFGVLLAVGRMHTDNEIIALQASGISLRRLLRPVLGVAIVMTGLNAYLTLEVIPDANQRLRDLKTRLFSSAKALGHVEARTFYEGFPKVLLYVDEVDSSTGYWRNVIMYDRTDPEKERLTLARRGRTVVGPSGQGDAGSSESDSGYRNNATEPWLLLEDVVTHEFMPEKADTYRVIVNQSQLHRLSSRREGKTRYSRGIQEMSLAELMQVARGQDGEADREDGQGGADELRRRLASLEAHKRFAIPSACLVFSLLALPLGIGSRSGGRGRGFIVSIGVILAYYIVFNNGELLAAEGKVPLWMGIWMPNILLSVIGVLMMLRMGRWLGERQRQSWLTRLVKDFNDWRARRRQRVRSLDRGVTGSIPISLQRRRYGSGFPTLLDRYVTTRLLAPLVLVLMSTASLYIVVDLTQHIDEIGRNKVALGVVLAYFWNLVPQVVMDVTPFGLMIATLILLTVLERQLELTALKAGGLSLYRLMAPVLIVAAVCAGGLWFLQESVVPRANREAKRLLDMIRGIERTRSYRATDRQWLLARDGDALYNFLQYHAPSQTMARFTLFEFDDTLNLRFHLFAHRIRYQNGSWIADAGWFRQIYPDGTDEFRQISSPMEIRVPEGPEYFSKEYRHPAEMSFNELKMYIQQLVDSAYQPVKLRVRLHQKISRPLSAFVMVLLALPFGLNRGGRRVTTMGGVALALGLGIGYFVLIAVFGEMGEADLLPPVLGAWAPLGIAVLFALNRLTTLRT